MLLVYLDDDQDSWQRRDASGRSTSGSAAESPAQPRERSPRGARAERTIAIVPASRMRTLSLVLPPAPPDKLPRVVRFALEEQLAGDVEAQHVVVAGMRGGKTVVHALERAWLAARAARLAGHGAGPWKIVAESDLVPSAAEGAVTWVWRDDGGFLIGADGRVSILDRGEDALPAGLLLALAGAPPPAVIVRGPSSLAGEIDAWAHATGVPFALAPAWRWTDADARALESAVDLAMPELESARQPQIPDRTARWWRRAAGWAIAALVVHVGASVAEWTALALQTSRIERETRSLVAAAMPGRGSEAQADVAAWRHAYADARHRQGRPAPDDALPLLSDTAAVLSDLPPASVRVIQYEAGQLTLDFEKSAAAALANAAERWPAHGLAVLQAELPGALRVRVTRE